MRRLRIAATRRTKAERSPAGRRLQAGNAFVAASRARAASAGVPSGNRPMTCRKSLGLTDSKCFAAPTALPPMRFLPWIGSLVSTRARAARKTLRCASLAKSVRASLRNSGSNRDLRARNLSEPVTDSGREPEGRPARAVWRRRVVLLPALGGAGARADARPHRFRDSARAGAHPRRRMRTGPPDAENRRRAPERAGHGTRSLRARPTCQ